MWQPSWICTYIFSNFIGVSRRNILINIIEIAHTARTYYPTKCVTEPHLLFSKTIFLNYFFTAHAYFKPELLMILYAFRILQQYYIEFQQNASVTHFRILSTCVM